MAKIFIYEKETDKLLKEVRSYRESYTFRYYHLRDTGNDTYVKKSRKTKTEKQNLDKSCEELWRKIINHKGNYACEKCGRVGKLDSHHIIGRQNKRTRWDVSNGILLCSHCHTLSSEFSAHKTPSKFNKWLCEYKGTGYYEILEQRASYPQKQDLKLTLVYLQLECRKRGI